MQEAPRGAERGARGGQGLVAGAAGTEQRTGTGQRQGELAEEGGGPAGAGRTVFASLWISCSGRRYASFLLPFVRCSTNSPKRRLIRAAEEAAVIITAR